MDGCKLNLCVGLWTRSQPPNWIMKNRPNNFVESLNKEPSLEEGIFQSGTHPIATGGILT